MSLYDHNFDRYIVNKRRYNVSIRGVTESTDENIETRGKEDENRVQELFHELNCDEASVNDMFRLGRKQKDINAKTRPIRLTLSSEGQKEKLLRMSKNLRWKSNAFEKVFIHQDLTPNQREKRHKLVEEIKLKNTQGETDLIIINGKIMKRWSPQETRTESTQ